MYPIRSPFRSEKLDKNTVVSLTQEGKRLVEQDLIRGAINNKILSMVESKPHCVVGDLADDLNIDIDELKKRLKTMHKQRLVDFLGEGGI